ncbi:NAD(P)-dependent alcohol dehydrogenase [Mesorhizobium sp. M3A.F.Ca.ET.201.01.1.1]|uniref:NAD(P)-dependent alcohol dehydrogenase n=1 Tax=Mesorhizobium sp. M3A.F.Ca.ET.201.01.1.1 TaxID=2563946 RepID=UPI001093ED0D|nr:NAD(P)-dependent alcohol dehydrogenase [Mesorhizobium sp. M3A.F.Ca.ET.201.01.1.1]TGS71713.1 NAD(P)-dependent alcohol dehydrogenase [Mesorhizobium sp. M3A.F.Ca.ET.201.01.1.1]
MEIKAAVARAPHDLLNMETLELEAPRADEILIKLVATGICHTDIAMRDQIFPVPQPIVLGHEGAGVVVNVGSAVRTIVAGDHVVMSFDYCGICESCREHAPQYCDAYFEHNFAGRRHDGSTCLSHGQERVYSNFFGQSSFASHALCRERNVVRVPNDVPLKILGPLGCGIQTGAGAVINSFAIGIGQSIAVFGLGTVGLSAVMAAKLRGAKTIIGIDLHANRRDLAIELGATDVLDGRDHDISRRIKSITGNGVNFAFDTTGLPAVIRAAVDSMAHRGVCGIVGAAAPGTEMALDVMDIMTAGRSIRGIVEGDANSQLFIPHLIELQRQGRFPFEKLMTFYDFVEINRAIADTESGKVIKPVLVFPQ